MIALIKALFGEDTQMNAKEINAEIDEMSDAFIYSLNLDEQDIHPGLHG